MTRQRSFINGIVENSPISRTNDVFNVKSEQVLLEQRSANHVGAEAIHGTLCCMEDSVRPVSLPHCLSPKELNDFLDLIQVAVERLGENILIVYAEVGPVSWTWNEALNQFCVRPLVGG